VSKRVGVLFSADHLAVNRLTSRRQQSFLGELRGGSKQVVLGWPAHCRGQPHDMSGVIGQGCNAGQEDSLKPSREFLTRLITLGSEQLLSQERVAIRASEDALDGHKGGWSAEDAAQQPTEVLTAEGCELDSFEVPGPVKLDQNVLQWVLRVEFVATVRRHDQETLMANHPDEEYQQIQCRAICPVEIFNDHHNRLSLRQPVKEAEEQLEQPRPRESTDRFTRARRRYARQQSCEVVGSRTEELVELCGVEVAGEATQRINDRAVRQAATTQLEAPTKHDLGLIAHLSGELFHQPGLADTGLTNHEQRGWLACGC
jgi:hypothetical protein